MTISLVLLGPELPDMELPCICAWCKAWCKECTPASPGVALRHANFHLELPPLPNCCCDVSWPQNPGPSSATSSRDHWSLPATGTWQCTKKTLSLPPQSQQFRDSVGGYLTEGHSAEGTSRLFGPEGRSQGQPEPAHKMGQPLLS
jgi:hypothetical protein